MPMCEFQIGDRVTCTYPESDNDDIVGKSGVVIYKKVWSHMRSTVEYLVDVQFDDPIEMGHAGYHDNGTRGHCWSFIISAGIEKLIPEETGCTEAPSFDELF